MARIKHIAARIPDGKRKSFPVGVSNNKTKTEINTNSSTDTSTNNNEKKKKIVVNVKGKRRYKSGTVAIREIRKYTKTTDHLFPDAPFARLVREIGYDFKSDIRYTSQAMLALHEAAEQYITEKFIKADLARRHAKRKTLQLEDLQFTPYMTHIASEVVGNTIV